MNGKFKALYFIIVFVCLMVYGFYKWNQSGAASLSPVASSPSAPPAASNQGLSTERPSEQYLEPTKETGDYVLELQNPARIPNVSHRPVLGGIKLLDDNLLITSQALAYAGIPESRKSEIQAEFDKTFTVVKSLLQKHAIIDETRNDVPAKISAYKITPFPNEGIALLSSLHKVLADSLGDASTQRLMSCFAWRDYFAAFGQKEILVEFTDQQSRAGHNSMQVRWEERQGQTGETLRKVTGPISSFEKYFGKLFQVTDN